MIRARSLIGAAVTGFRCMSGGATSTCDAARLWGTRDVVKWAEQLGTYGPKIAPLLEKEEVDGTALLDLSEGQLEKMGLKVGPRMNLLKAIAALTGAPTLAVDVPDKLHEPITLIDEDGSVVEVRAEKDFERLTFGGGKVTVMKDGVVVKTVTSWADVVTASRDPDVALHLGHGVHADVSNLKRWRYNQDTGFERESTMALVHDPRLKQYWPLEPLNEGRGVVFVRRGVHVLQVDGILRNTDVLLVNEAKAAADVVHAIGGVVKGGGYVKGVRERAAEVADYAADPEVTTIPPAVMDVVRAFKGKGAVPVLSTRHATPATVEACRENNIHLLLPQGPGGMLTL